MNPRGKVVTPASKEISKNIVELIDNLGFTFTRAGKYFGISGPAAHKRYHKAKGHFLATRTTDNNYILKREHYYQNYRGPRKELEDGES